MALCKQAFEHSYENIVGLLPPVPVQYIFDIKRIEQIVEGATLRPRNIAGVAKRSAVRAGLPR